MAKKKAVRKKAGVNKSQAIRDYLAAHKGAKAATVVEELGKQGVKVSMPLVYQQVTKKKGRKKTARGSANGSVRIEDLKAASKLVKAMGGVERAKAALSVLESLK